MEQVVVRARKVGGSVAVIVPKEVVKKERISPNDKVRLSIQRVDELTDWWGNLKWAKKPTARIIKEIDEGEDE